jgi:RNA polymerase sigma-70 factor (ECF subfamily)
VKLTAITNDILEAYGVSTYGEAHRVGADVGTDEQDSYRDFVAVRWRPLLRTAYLLTGDAGRAEDLLQTALARLWLVWPRVRNEAPEAYVRKILANTSASWWRRRWHGELPTEALPDRAGNDDIADAASARDEIRVALAALTPRQRAVIVLRYAEDMSELQVADALGVTVGTVKTLTSRGLARLRSAPSLANANRPANEVTL